MEIAEECPLDNLFRLLAQTAARVIRYLSNRKEIDQSFVKTVLENKDNLHKIVYRVKRGFVYRKYHADILSFVILLVFSGKSLLLLEERGFLPADFAEAVALLVCLCLESHFLKVL